MGNAMTTNQKLEKSAQIAQAALQLFKERAFDEITMAQIAKRAGVAKGTLFNYYQSKENIFMNLLLTGYQNYFLELDARVKQLGQVSLPDFKALMLQETTNLIENHAVLLRLNALRGPILERQADKAQTIAGRQKLYDISQQLSQDIAQRVDGLSTETINHLFVTQSAIISGLMNLSGLEQFNHEQIPVGLFDFQVAVKPEARHIFGLYMTGLFKEQKADEQQ
ncbi:MAG: TetR/AcrR family transcriptional regulator [Lactobacillus sp.]|jgi:hypothetical protein|nr:TetR/AcrR family transcriptional regulator [Lactobacillus sp.]